MAPLARTGFGRGAGGGLERRRGRSRREPTRARAGGHASRVPLRTRFVDGVVFKTFFGTTFFGTAFGTTFRTTAFRPPFVEEDAFFSHGTSDELDNGTGDGNTYDDLDFRNDCSQVRVRAERGEDGPGRTYTITVECRDDTGDNASEAETSVFVPHDQGRRGGNGR